MLKAMNRMLDLEKIARGNLEVTGLWEEVKDELNKSALKLSGGQQLLLKRKEHFTIVIVTHNLFQARRIADDCIFVFNGELWEQNTTEELFNHPQRQETKDYLQGAYA